MQDTVADDDGPIRSTMKSSNVVRSLQRRDARELRVATRYFGLVQERLGATRYQEARNEGGAMSLVAALLRLRIHRLSRC